MKIIIHFEIRCFERELHLAVEETLREDLEQRLQHYYDAWIESEDTIPCEEYMVTQLKQENFKFEEMKTICINKNTNKLYFITNAPDLLIQEYLKDINTLTDKLGKDGYLAERIACEDIYVDKEYHLS